MTLHSSSTRLPPLLHSTAQSSPQQQAAPSTHSTEQSHYPPPPPSLPAACSTLDKVVLRSRPVSRTAAGSCTSVVGDVGDGGLRRLLTLDSSATALGTLLTRPPSTTGSARVCGTLRTRPLPLSSLCPDYHQCGTDARAHAQASVWHICTRTRTARISVAHTHPVSGGRQHRRAGGVTGASSEEL